MVNLDRKGLRRLIQLEIKKIMDEDALFIKRKIPGDYDDDVSYFRQAHSHDDAYPYNDDEDEDFFPDVLMHSPETSYMKIRLDEGSGGDCGCHSQNPYEEEREEDFDHDDHNYSSYMARPQLYKIAKYASKLLDMIDENEELDDWQESKIAQISQMIGSVYHSLDYDEEYDDHDDLNVNDLIGMIKTGNI